MSVPAPPTAAALGRVLAAIDPALSLVASGPLSGGVSSQVTCVEAGMPGGPGRRLVVRQYGPANLRSDPQSATHEHQLLALLHAAGLPVPCPLAADESCGILPSPYLVTEFIDGEICTEPGRLTVPVAEFTSQLAAVLARVHTAGLTPAQLPYLPDINAAAMRRLATRPAILDSALMEAQVRAALAGSWPPPQLNDPALLHGDFWPGNVLWRHGALVGVLDWEDAAYGDALADLSLTRMELCMAFGTAAMRQFTSAYRTRMPSLSFAALRHWDLYAALRHAGRMDDWGLQPPERERLEAGHREFTRALLSRPGYPGAPG